MLMFDLCMFFLSFSFSVVRSLSQLPRCDYCPRFLPSFVACPSALVAFPVHNRSDSFMATHLHRIFLSLSRFGIAFFLLGVSLEIYLIVVSTRLFEVVCAPVCVWRGLAMTHLDVSFVSACCWCLFLALVVVLYSEMHRFT